MKNHRDATQLRPWPGKSAGNRASCCVANGRSPRNRALEGKPGNPSLPHSTTSGAPSRVSSPSKTRHREPRAKALLILSWIFAVVALGAEKPAETATRPPKPPMLDVNGKADPLKIALISYANPQQVAKDA